LALGQGLELAARGVQVLVSGVGLTQISLHRHLLCRGLALAIRHTSQ